MPVTFLNPSRGAAQGYTEYHQSIYRLKCRSYCPLLYNDTAGTVLDVVHCTYDTLVVLESMLLLFPTLCTRTSGKQTCYV